MKKGDKVVWRVTSGFCTQEFTGKITATRKRLGKLDCYVLFDGGGHWLSESELEKAE
jgi:hypothetical protein